MSSQIHTKNPNDMDESNGEHGRRKYYWKEKYEDLEDNLW